MTMLLNALLQGVVFAAAVYLLLIQFPRLNAATRYAVWYLTLLAVAALPLRPLVGFFGIASPLSVVQSESILQRGRPVRVQSVLSGAVAAPSLEIIPLPAKSTFGTWRPIQLAARPVRSVIIVLWSAASIALFIRLAAGYASLLRLKRRARAAPASLTARVQSLAARALHKRRAALLVSADVAAPMVLGLFEPTILIPASLVGKIGWGDFDHIALHELAHLRRYDDWMNLAQKVLEALLPIQPALFWIGRQINLAREAACDDCVIAATGSPKPYVESLTRIAELACGARAGLLASGAVGNPSQLYRRVQHLLDRRGNVMPRVRVAPLSVSAGVIAVLLWMTLYAPQVVALAEPAPGTPAPADVPSEPGTLMRSFTVAPGSKFAVDVDLGHVQVDVWDKDTVQIIVKQRGPGLAEFLKHHFISMTQEGQEVRVKATGDSWLSSHDPKVQIDYELTIPAKLDGSIKDGAGNVDVARTGGTIDASTGAGNIGLTGLVGPVSGRSGAGNIDASDCREILEAKTGDGNIDIQSFAGPAIEAKTGTGNISADLSNQIKSDSVLQSGMGNISVTVKATMAVNLEANSGSGRVESQLPMGALNGGGPHLSIKSGMGDIEVKKE
jgi:beta-lactamase regulating signal transducer with metallopeptidase domain